MPRELSERRPDASDALIAGLEPLADLVACSLGQVHEFFLGIPPGHIEGTYRSQRPFGLIDRETGLVGHGRDREVVDTDHGRCRTGEQIERHDLSVRLPAEFFAATSRPERRGHASVVTHHTPPAMRYRSGLPDGFVCDTDGVRFMSFLKGRVLLL
jgi:hypothetical protein